MQNLYNGCRKTNANENTKERFMKLTTQELSQLVHGAERIAEEGGKVHFYRFTKAQQEL